MPSPKLTILSTVSNCVARQMIRRVTRRAEQNDSVHCSRQCISCSTTAGCDPVVTVNRRH